jgi:hypothetical protein
LGPVSETSVVPAPSVVGVVSRGRLAGRATSGVAVATIFEARAAVPKAEPTLPGVGTTSLGDETRYLAREIANSLHEFRIVRSRIDGCNRGW